jgi:hypothetical protein
MKILLLLLILLVSSQIAFAQDAPAIKIFDKKCEKCLTFAFVEARYYNERNMRKLAESLAAKYESNKGISISIFDNESVIEAYRAGVREPINLMSDRRAFFVHSLECGDLLFYKPRKKDIRTIRLRWEKTEQCSKPFAV